MVMRHGIEELQFDVLCKRVSDFMANAAANGHPVWSRDTAAVANDLMEFDDEVLACHVQDVLAAVDAAKARHCVAKAP